MGLRLLHCFLKLHLELLQSPRAAVSPANFVRTSSKISLLRGSESITISRILFNTALISFPQVQFWCALQSQNNRLRKPLPVLPATLLGSVASVFARAVLHHERYLLLCLIATVKSDGQIICRCDSIGDFVLKCKSFSACECNGRNCELLRIETNSATCRHW